MLNNPGCNFPSRRMVEISSAAHPSSVFLISHFLPYTMAAIALFSADLGVKSQEGSSKLETLFCPSNCGHGLHDVGLHFNVDLCFFPLEPGTVDPMSNDIPLAFIRLSLS
jgi:hypothetical protein